MEDQRRVRVLRPNSSHEALRVRQRELRKLGRRQVVRPRVEQLDDLGAAVDLVADVHPQRVRQVAQQRVQQLRLVEHHLLGGMAVLVSAPFN